MITLLSQPIMPDAVVPEGELGKSTVEEPFREHAMYLIHYANYSCPRPGLFHSGVMDSIPGTC
jgi:hypothetical protein